VTSLVTAPVLGESRLSCKPGFYFQSLTKKDKNKATQVRGLLYKLRLTWGDRYQVFTDQKLYQLDKKIRTIDPAWPVTVPKERPPTGVPSTKIHVNPAFVGKTPPPPTPPVEEDETERMRAELLRKEKELILLKQQHIDNQIKMEKEKMLQVTYNYTVPNTVKPVKSIINEINIDLFQCFNVILALSKVLL